MKYCGHCRTNKPDDQFRRNGAGNLTMCIECTNQRHRESASGIPHKLNYCFVCREWKDAADFIVRQQYRRDKCRSCDRIQRGESPEQQAKREAIKKAEKWEHMIYMMTAEEFCAMVESWPDGQPPADIIELNDYADLAESESAKRSANTKKQPDVVLE